VDYFDNHCIEDIVKCQNLAAELDPNDNGNIDEVNKACDIAETCAHKMIGPYGDEVCSREGTVEIYSLTTTIRVIMPGSTSHTQH
jgi:hypothetical protein